MIAHQDDLSRDAIVGYAQQAGLDVTRSPTRSISTRTRTRSTKEVAAAKEIGVTATPEFLINGKDFTGARPIETSARHRRRAARAGHPAAAALVASR